MTELYFSDCSFISDKEKYSLCYRLLSDERKKKADAYRFEKDKCLSATAYLLLRCVAKQHGLTDRDMKISCGSNGKPFIPNSHFHFNISHSGRYVMLSWGEWENGCDVEEIKKADTDIAKRFFTPNEYRYVVSSDNDNLQNEAFFRIWTAKESYIKLTGEGLSRSLSSFEIEINDIPLMKNGDLSFYQRLYDGCVFTACSYDKDFSPLTAVTADSLLTI